MNLQAQFRESKILRWFTIIDYTLKIHFKIMHFISLIFYKDAYQAGLYIVILTDVQGFFPGTVLLFYHYCIHQSNLADRSLE